MVTMPSTSLLRATEDHRRARRGHAGIKFLDKPMPHGDRSCRPCGSSAARSADRHSVSPWGIPHRPTNPVPVSGSGARIGEREIFLGLGVVRWIVRQINSSYGASSPLPDRRGSLSMTLSEGRQAEKRNMRDLGVRLCAIDLEMRPAARDSSHQVDMSRSLGVVFLAPLLAESLVEPFIVIRDKVAPLDYLRGLLLSRGALRKQKRRPQPTGASRYALAPAIFHTVSADTPTFFLSFINHPQFVFSACTAIRFNLL